MIQAVWYDNFASSLTHILTLWWIRHGSLPATMFSIGSHFQGLQWSGIEFLLDFPVSLPTEINWLFAQRNFLFCHRNTKTYSVVIVKDEGSLQSLQFRRALWGNILHLTFVRSAPISSPVLPTLCFQSLFPLSSVLFILNIANTQQMARVRSSPNRSLSAGALWEDRSPPSPSRVESQVPSGGACVFACSLL